MAGRPRTMLKRIADWQQQAQGLFEDILHHIPPGYFDYAYGMGVYDHEDKYGQIDFKKIPGFDPVAFQWSEVCEYAEQLEDALIYLQKELTKRLERKGLSDGYVDNLVLDHDADGSLGGEVLVELVHRDLLTVD